MQIITKARAEEFFLHEIDALKAKFDAALGEIRVWWEDNGDGTHSIKADQEGVAQAQAPAAVEPEPTEPQAEDTDHHE